ncbi:MAG: hypothetical protein F7C33_00285 [Desulfurococcales archaeon]|nr:hypothetical protein [Desulfurococcales archaeon]
MARSCVFVNTSIVIRALNPREPGSLEAQRLLRECCRRCRCVWSAAHSREGFRYGLARFFFHGYLASLGAEYVEVDLDHVMNSARRYVDAYDLSPSRLIDIAHLVAANTLGCRFILARDRFMWRHANNFGLVYVNWETHGGKCPCPSLRQGRSGSRAFESGARGATRQASSSTSSQTYHATACSARRPGESTRTGRKSGSRSKKPRKSSGSSPLGRRRKRGASRQGHSKRPRHRGGG